MKTGLYDLPMREYLQLNALSSGVLHTLMSASPHHARHAQMNRSDSSEADIGTYAHAMLLEGAHTGLEIIEMDDWRTKAAKAAREACRMNGKLPILARKVPEVKSMVAAARAYIAESDIAGVFDDGKPEQTLIWTETTDDGEILCKARPDWLSDRYMLHFKTTLASVNPRQFSRIASNSGYDLAMMFYQRGLNEVLPDNECQHFILAQEQSAPYACKLFDLTSARADVADNRIDRAIGVWARCVANNLFPAYDGAVHSIDLSAWELAQAEEELQAAA